MRLPDLNNIKLDGSTTEIIIFVVVALAALAIFRKMFRMVVLAAIIFGAYYLFFA